MEAVQKPEQEFKSVMLGIPTELCTVFGYRHLDKKQDKGHTNSSSIRLSINIENTKS